MIALILWWKNRLPKAFGLLAFMMVIKYGIWAVIINLHFWYLTGEFTLENWMLTLSHAGMALEGYLFVKDYFFGRWPFIFGAGWLVIEDIADYGFGLHPYLFDESQWTLALVTAVFLTLLILFSIYKKSGINKS